MINNTVNSSNSPNTVTITDNNAGTTVNVTQPVTNVVTVATPGPQGPVGPIPTSGSFTGSFSGSFIGNLTGTASYATSASYALTASYLEGYISPFPYSGSAVITGSLTVSGSSTLTNIGPAIFSGSLIVTEGITGSLFGTSSYALTASYAMNGGSGGGNFIATGSISASVSLGTGSFTITSGSSTFMFVSSSGNVGIGTNTPTSTLLVKGTGTSSTTNSLIVQNSAGTNMLQLRDDNYQLIGGWLAMESSRYIYRALNASGILTLSNDSTVASFVNMYGSSHATLSNVIDLGTASTSRLRLLSNGNVLIGTTTDAGYKLDVNGSLRATSGEFGSGQLALSSNMILGYNGIRLRGGAAASTGGVSVGNLAGPQANTQLYVLGYGTTSATTSLLVQNSNTSSSLAVLDNGYVGIGTSTPTVTLDVLGNESRFSTSTGALNLYFQPGVNQHNNFINTRQDSDFIFKQNVNGAVNTSTFLIKGNTGNILVNTTTDAGFKLDVNGTARVISTLISDTDIFRVTNGNSVNVLRVQADGDLNLGGSSDLGIGSGLGVFTRYSLRVGALTYTDASAILQADSTTRGFLPPRTNLTSNISTPAQGLITYVTASATEGLYYYNSGSNIGWHRMLTNSGSQDISGSLNVTSFTASNATISGNVTVLGTASINTLIVNQTQYTSGSNQLGDAADDFQTLYGTVRIPTGSLTVSGALAVSSSQNSYFVGGGRLGIGTTNPASLLHLSGTPGSVANSGIYFSGNTAIWQQASSTLTIRPSGTDISTFTTTGVGIGTSIPTSRLHIQGSGATSSTTALRVENTNASASLVVLDNGFVGIGTGSAQYQLDLYGSYHQYQAQGELARYDISSANANQNRGIWSFYTNAAATPDFFGRFGFKFEGGTADSFKQFQIHIADSTTPKFIVDGSGRVGIGTITPAASLHISGASSANLLRIDSPASSNILFVSGSGNVGIGTSTPAFKFDTLGSATSGVSIVGQFIGGTGTSAGGLRLGAYSAAYGGFWSANVTPTTSNYALISSGADTGLNSTNTINFYINNNSVSSVTSTGLGIGTTSPSSRLQVRGSGATSATTNFILQNSTPTNLMTVLDNGQFTFSSPIISLATTQSAFTISQSISQSNVVGAQVYGVNITPTFFSTTSSQTETALRVAATFTGSAAATAGTNIIADFGATSAGSQFTVTDVTSGSIYMVNDVSGLPILEATSDWTVNMYNFPNIILQKTGSQVNINGTLRVSGSFILPLSQSISPQTGSAYWSGSFLFVYDGTRYRSSSFA